LCARAGFHPDDREPDPGLLVSALEELEEARAVWLEYEKQVAMRRRAEKRHGIRQPAAHDEWHRLTWGGRSLLPYDPSTPPAPRLAEVLRRTIATMDKDVGKDVIRLAGQNRGASASRSGAGSMAPAQG
jgi:hypothetical protein